MQREQARNDKLIGGTDAAAIMGTSKYRTPLDVYLRIVEGVNPPSSEPADWGKILERPIARRFEQVAGLTLARAPSIEHPKDGREWQRISPDFFVLEPAEFATHKHIDNDGVVYEGLRTSRQIVEVKTAGLFAYKDWGEPGTDEIPDDYLIQVQAYLEALDAELAYVPVLVGGQQLAVYTVEPDRELGAMIVAECERFWRDHVVPRRPPDLERSTDTFQAWLRSRYKDHGADIRLATPDERLMMQALHAAKVRMKAAEEAEQLCGDRLRQAIGGDAGLEAEFGKVTWKRTKDSEVVDWEAAAKEMKAALQLLGAAEVAADILEQRTSVKPGHRRLLLQIKKGE